MTLLIPSSALPQNQVREHDNTERFNAGLLPSLELGNVRSGHTEGVLEDERVRRTKTADLLPPATQGQLGNKVFRAASALISLLGAH